MRGFSGTFPPPHSSFTSRFPLHGQHGTGVFGELGILDGGEAEAFGAVGAPYGTEKFFFGAGKEGVLGGVQRAVNDNEGIGPGIEGLPYDLILTVFVVAEESRHEDLL